MFEPSRKFVFLVRMASVWFHLSCPTPALQDETRPPSSKKDGKVQIKGAAGPALEARESSELVDMPEGGMIRLEALHELKLSIRAFRAYSLIGNRQTIFIEQFEPTVSQSKVPSPS